LTCKEILSLLIICVGVLISTLFGNAKETTTISSTLSSSTLIIQSLFSSSIVMCSNLCFSFRGLYQKLYHSSTVTNDNIVNNEINHHHHHHNNNNNNTSTTLSDNQLQLKVHQIGTIILLILYFIMKLIHNDIIVVDNNIILQDTISVHDNENDIMNEKTLSSYLILAFINAFAFTHYK